MGLIAGVAGMWQWEQVESWVVLRWVMGVLGAVELMRGLEEFEGLAKIEFMAANFHRSDPQLYFPCWHYFHYRHYYSASSLFGLAKG